MSFASILIPAIPVCLPYTLNACDACVPTESPTMTRVPVVSGKECSKCGKSKKSSKRSCCTRDGAWFKKCGDVGDPKFAHTWLEGIQACENSKLIGPCFSLGGYQCVLYNVNGYMLSGSPEAPKSPTMTRVPVVSGKECSKCGKSKKSSKLSCCTPGGAWFKKCGDVGDPKFAHTWLEGIEACEKSKLIGPCFSLGGYQCVLCNVNACMPTESPESPTTARVPMVSGKKCSKCGRSKKSGQLSCCTRGGTWFKKCGDIGDPKFAHTWSEGIQACTETASLFSSKTQVLLHHRQPNGAKEQNVLKQKLIESTGDYTSSITSQNYKGFCSLLTVIILMNLMNIVLH